MKCHACGQDCVETTIAFTARWQGQQVTFRNLPALKCDGCGAVLLGPEAADFMSNLVDEKLRRGETVPDVLTVEEAANYLRVSTQTVYNLQKAGQLPGARIGGQLRFLKTALEALLRPGTAGRQEAGVAASNAVRAVNDLDRPGNPTGSDEGAH